jgi:hypothetical protein
MAQNASGTTHDDPLDDHAVSREADPRPCVDRHMRHPARLLAHLLRCRPAAAR